MTRYVPRFGWLVSVCIAAGCATAPAAEGPTPRDADRDAAAAEPRSTPPPRERREPREPDDGADRAERDADRPRARPSERPDEPLGTPRPDAAPPIPTPTRPAPAPRASAPATAPLSEPLPVPSVPVEVGAVLPRERIIAFYGNPASTRMGILGELPPEQMLARLDDEVRAWRTADPFTPVRPALHLIAVMAAADPGPDSLYLVRQPTRRIEQVMEWAERREALVFLDIQPGRSTVQAELPRLERWLTEPHVHLALDPEWAMGPDGVPGQRIGSMSAADVNFAVEFLARLVDEHDLPPKVLVVHRFTQNMVRNARDIRLDPRVQVVLHMDGWGPPAQKIRTYRDFVAPEATQFTGFKLFYHNDLRGGSRLLTPGEILELRPVPFYIQYQ